MAQHNYILHSFDCLNVSTATRLHDMGLCEGCPIKVIQRYPFHGPVIIENDHQRIGLRYQVFASLTGVNDK
ncbi:FeoA family protein [Limosilactobacillus walteri]|uniref:Ferrous iron transport protein A n=1 Tax=Limosilactobacillus walteri TaxID=2268022 RepID=A0ABR8P7R6_9LACO|nr:FeoA family protein [Limosilactobacillus walteri]MBD5806746.1 ferrous iron transport protein A [Limosilactobacillus walteri]